MKNSALIVIDLQNDIMRTLPKNQCGATDDNSEI